MREGLAVTLKVTLLVHRPGLALTAIFPGQMIVGGWLSRTVTVNVQLLVLPLASVAVEATVVVPRGKDEPLGGALTTTGVPAQLSVAVTLKVTLLAHWPGMALTVMFPGQADRRRLFVAHRYREGATIALPRSRWPWRSRSSFRWGRRIRWVAR